MEVQAVQFGDIQESEMKDKAAQLTKNQKVKKASSQDANPLARSTRSSCRHH